MLKEKARKMLGKNNMVEIDEAYVGGREKSKHAQKQRSNVNPHLKNDGSPYKPKSMVVGLIERGGDVVIKKVPRAVNYEIQPIIDKHVKIGSEVHTDESRVYRSLNITYDHSTVVHSAKQNVVGNFHTNTIENFWIVLKRGLYGVYHQVSDKHFEAYLDEYAGRFNTRKLTAQERFEGFLGNSESVLPYNLLTSK